MSDRSGAGEAPRGGRSGGTSAADRVAADLRAALKGRESVRLGTLRLLSTAVKNREVELRRPVTEEEFVDVVAREVKRRREAVDAYERAGRPDRAAREREEQTILEQYLPPPLAEEEIDALVEHAVQATGARSPGDLGKVMGYVMGRAKGRVDGARAQAKVRARLHG